MEALEVPEKARRVLRLNPRVLFAYLFGSRARGDASSISDIDVAVYFEPLTDPVADKLTALGALVDGLQTDNVDLVLLNTASLPLQARVVRDGIVIVDRMPFSRHCFESLVLRKHFDFSRVEQAILRRRFSIA